MSTDAAGTIAAIFGFFALIAMGCAPQGNVVGNCPLVTAWSAADERAFVAAEKALPTDNPLWLKIEDDQRLRDWARACEKAR